MSLENFRSTLDELNSGFTEQEVLALSRRFRNAASSSALSSTGGGGAHDSARVINYFDLLHALSPMRDIDWDSPDEWRVEEKLRSMIKNKFEYWLPGKLKKAFKFF